MQNTALEGVSLGLAVGREVQDDSVVEARTRRRILTHIARRSPARTTGASLALLAVAIAACGVLLAPYPSVIPDYSAVLGTPSWTHPFGTDQIGRDVLSRVLSGAHLSLAIAASVVLSGALIGTVVGLLAGYAGGLVDEALMRLTDVFLAFPALVLALAITAALGTSMVNVAIALSVVWWPYYARLVRGQVLVVREREYVEAAHALGVGHLRAMWRHILPNSLTPIIVQMSLDVGFAVLAISSLSFIGLGAQPPTPEWGAMIADAQSYVRSAWWVAAFPGMAIMLTVIGFNMLADLLQDAFDPRLRS